jgi:hypothetical protein
VFVRSCYIVRELQNEPLRSDSSATTLRIFYIQMTFTLNVSFCKGFHQRAVGHNLRYMTAPQSRSIGHGNSARIPRGGPPLKFALWTGAWPQTRHDVQTGPRPPDVGWALTPSGTV